MKNNYISQLHFISKHLCTLLVIGLLVFGAGRVSGANRYSVATGNWNATSTWSDASGGTPGKSVPANGDNVYIEGGRTVTLNRNSASLTLLYIASGSQLTSTSDRTLTASTITLNGYYLNGSTGTITGTMTVGTAGIYEHNINGGTIPNATWNTGSLLKITGITSTIVTLPTNIGGNVEWNCPNQTVSGQILSNANNTINGNFTLTNTGTGNIYLWNQTGTGYTLNIGGNYSQSGGNLTVDKIGTNDVHTISINGNWNISGGTFDCSGNNGNVANINIKGNWTQSGGTLTETSSGNGNITFNGTTTQIYTKTGGTISNTINFAVINGASLDVGSSIINGGGTFTLNSGASIITANAQGLSTSGATGSIQVTGTRTYNTGANYTYNGTSAQVTGNGLTQNTPANLTINSTNAVTLSAATTLSGNLLISTGILNTSNYDLSLGGNFNNSGTFTAGSSNITLNGTATQSIDGLTTTGTVNLLKTGSVATFQGNVNAANLTINGTGGTLNLGSGKSHTFTGTVTGTAGTLQAGSSTLNINGIISWSGAIWDYGTSTVNYGGADQNVLVGPYYSLTLSGTGTKAFTGTTTINNTFSINNNVAANLGNLTHTATVYFLAGTQQSIGSWGGTGSTATNKNSVNFSPSVTGILNVTAGCAAGYWKGTTSTDWNTASNWCDLTVPTAATNVIIPSSPTNQPVIGSAGGLCNNIVINSGATVTTSGGNSLTVSGNFTNNGTFTANSGSVIFNGTTAQSISGSTSTTFYNLTMLNSGPSGNNSITLNQPIAIADKGTLLLASGNIITNSTNLLTINNPVNSGIMGGSASSYINGPVKWILAYSGSAIPTTYTFPIGKTSYLPFTIKGFIPSWQPYLYLEAFDGTSGGSPDASLTSLSSNEYWKLTTLTSDTYLDFSASTVSLGKATGIYPYDAITCLATNTNSSIGTYKSLGGTTNFYEVTNSAAISPSNTGLNYHYFALGGTTIPKITVAPPLLGGFAYTVNFGPSAEQTFTVNGSSLSTGITISAPTDFEISLTSGTGFQNAITLPVVDNKVASTIVYLRLKAGLIVGSYPTEIITLKSAGAADVEITCNGTVFASTPTITTSGGRLCDPNQDKVQLSSTASNINILYWTGPNNFYSQKDTLITSAGATFNGTYTVTGTLPTGANLLINGDFEAGNLGFLSSYSYINVTADLTNNTAEGIYAVIANPHWLHSGFSTSPDHTPDSGTKQMVINGATTANVTVWSETVKVVPNSTYQFSYWLQSVVDGNPSIIQLYANNQPIGTPFTAIKTVGKYKQYYYNWYSGSSTSVTLDLRNMNTIAGGNDFAIDDIDFRTVTYVSSSLEVSASTAAAVSISTPTTSVPDGTNATFTATPTNGGTAPLYQWYVNNVAVGTNSASSVFNYTPVIGDVIKCVMTSNLSCVTAASNPATSNLITMTVTGVKNYWLGATSTAWNDPNNWTAIKIPASGDNVEFATIGNNSGVAAKNDLYVDYNRIVGSIINNASGKNLIIPADKEVVVNNFITLTQVDANTKYDQIQIKCDPNPIDASRLPNGSIIFKNASNVNGTVEMYSKSTINASGPVDYQYFWQYFGVPVTTVTAEPTLYGAYVRRAYEPGTDGDPYYWTELTNADPLNKFIGHEICQTSPTVYTFKGQLVNTDFDSGLLAYTSTAKYPGQHLFANSYTAAIDIKKIELGSDMEQSIFLYNTGSYGDWTTNTGGSSNGSLAGQYISIPLSTAGSNNIPGEVPSMSSMLVKTGADRSAQSYMKFKYRDVIIKNSTIQRVKSVDAISSTDLVSTMIDLTGQHYSDRMWIFTEPSCTRNFDNGWDGRKILGSSLAPQIFAIEPDGDYQVNSVSDMHNTDIAFQAGDEVEYTLKFTHENIQQQYAGVYLLDLIENKTVDVTQSGSTYTFATAQSDAPAKRFKILTRPYEKGAPDMEAQVKIFTAPGRVFVHNLSSSKGDCTLYDIAGRAIKNAPFAANAVTEVLNNLTPGAYVVNAIANGEKLSKRVIVQ